MRNKFIIIIIILRSFGCLIRLVIQPSYRKLWLEQELNILWHKN